MKTHTPGPWVAQGGTICTDAAYPSWRVVAEIVFKNKTPVAADESDANARLIAAAPELLEALKILRIQVGDYRDGDGPAKFHACNIADAAIAKAEEK